MTLSTLLATISFPISGNDTNNNIQFLSGAERSRRTGCTNAALRLRLRYCYGSAQRLSIFSFFMKSTHPLAPIWVLPLVIFIALTSCAPTQTVTPLAPVSETPALSPTATVQWFPPTATLTPHLVQPPSATPVYLPGLGETLATDDFASGAAWNTVTSDQGNISVSRNRITIAVKEPQIYMISLRNEPLLTNFYAEISAHPALCRGGDSYGLLFRANNAAAYRYALACDGTVRLDRMSLERARVIHPPLPSGDVPPGSPGNVRLGVWAVGPEMRFFLNGRHQFTAVDVNLEIGTLGVFAQSAGETAMTVTFSDLVVQSVAYASPTPTMTPSQTPMPTSTRSP